MSVDILRIFKAIPPSIIKLYGETSEIANDELQLHEVGPAVLLLVIIRSKDHNSSTKWLLDIGLTEKVVVDYIRDDDLAWREHNKKAIALSNNPGSQRAVANDEMLDTLEYLVKLTEKPRERPWLFVYDVMNAVAHSENVAVRQIFRYAGLDMVQLREMRKVDSLDEIVKLYEQHHDRRHRRN